MSSLVDFRAGLFLLCLWAGLSFVGLAEAGKALRPDEFSSYGTVLLDSVTFDKVVPDDDNWVLMCVCNKGQIGKLSTDGVRDEFLAVAEGMEPLVGKSSILLAQVIVNGAQNRKLAGRIGVRDGFTYPSFHLYKPGSTEAIPFLTPTDKESPNLTMVEITRWVFKHTGIYLGATGTLDDLDILVNDFQAVGTDKAKQDVVLQQLKAAAVAYNNKSPEEKEYAAQYVRTMEKTIASASFPQTEVERVISIVESDKVSEARKGEFRARINIVRRFL